MRFANARDAMAPTFVAAQNFDFHAQKINRYFYFRFLETRHAHRVFLGGDNHFQIPPEAALDEAVQFRFGITMVVDVSFRKIDAGAEFF